MSNQLIVIGITGLARSGKDTIARILCSRFGFTRIALADGVRSAFRDLDGPTWELTKELESAGKTTRWALQTLGTECRLQVGAPGLWVELLEAKIQYLAGTHPIRRSRFVVPDIRFRAEAHYLSTKSLGHKFCLWKAVREGAGLSGDAAQHTSETDLAALIPDVTIRNNSSLLELETVVSTYARQLLEPANGLSSPLD